MSAVNILRKEVFLVNLHKNFPAVAGTAVVTAAIANSSSTQGEFADIFDVVKSQSEVAAASAKAGADIAVDFLKENAPEALNNIDVGTVPSVLTSIQGAVPSLVGEAIAKGDHISNLVIEKGPGIASDLGEYAVDAANTFRSIMPDIMRVAGDAAKLIGDVMAPAGAVIAHVAGQVANAISSDVAIASLTASLEGIGMVALTFPFLLPITQALKGLAQAIKFAMFNKEKALILADRCKETADCIKSLVPKLQKLLEEAESLLKPVEKAINECTDFVEKFTKRGFLLKLMQYSKDDFKLSVLDKKVTDALQNLSLRVSGEQYDLQVKTAEKLDDLFLMMKEKTGNNLDPSSISPTAMLEIAKKSGCVTSEEMTFELQGLGYKLDEIKSSIESVEKTVNAIDSKIDEVQVHLLTQKEAAEQHKKELMDALRKQEEDRNAHHEKASEMQAEMLRKQAEAQTLQMQTMMKLERLAGKAVPVVYSDANQSELVSNKAAAVVPDLRAANVVVIHPRGIGSPIEKREGENGTNGTHGTNHPPAMRGSDGGPSHDGGDGEDGEDGESGENGERGSDGEPAKNFEVFIKLLSIDTKQGTRTYAIEHSGPDGIICKKLDVKFPGCIFYIDGKGGDGGRGGNGGDGGNGGTGGAGGAGGIGLNQMDGGRGGDGGAGGQAGDPSQAGSGGDGQDGAEIIIRTNDPVVFMAMEVNVQGGKGGEGGLPGKEGQRGEGGAGGQGGMACTWQEPMNNGTSVVYVAKSSKPGKSGRAGRKGKAGRKIKAARASSGSNGTYGRFSLCLYEGDVLIESAGMPYRLMIDQKLEKKLHPVSLLGGKDDKEAKSFYIFGNKISLGPILPINIGCLSCPPPSLKCSLFLFRPGCPMVNASAAPVVFPPLPESRDTRYGELPQKEAKTVIIDVPSLSASGFLPDKLMMGPPWANKWSEAAKCTGKIIVQMCIEDIPFRRIETDKKFQCEKVFDNLCFDIPIEITKQSDNQALLIPASIGMSDFSVETTILVSVANKVDCKLPTMGELALAVAGDSFRPIVACVDGELASKDIPGGDGPTKYIAHEYRRAIPQLDRKETATFLYTVKLPAIADANSRAVQPGSHIAVQPQLYVDGVLAQFGPASFMRVAPPLPPSQNVEYKDILFFSFVDMQPSDYSILTAVSEAIGHKAHFLDCHHYMSRMNGIPGPVPAALWAGHVGKGVVVWVPPTASDNTLIPEQELFTHVQRGGHLICSGKATFKWNSSGSAPPTQESRRVILAGEQLRLWKIGSERVISGQEIDGTSLNILVLSIISSLSIDKKLQLLVDNRIICNMKLGNVLLPNYTIEVEAGCSCFGKKKTKVVPLQKTPCLLHDCILSAIVTDLTMDLAYFESHPRKDLCYSIQAIIRFVAKEIVNKKNTLEVSLLGRDIAAVFHASEIFEFSSTFRNKNSKTVWESFLLEINNAAYSCMNIATAKKLDYGGLGERLKEIEIVTSFTRMGGKSRKVHKLVEGVKHSFDVQKK